MVAFAASRDRRASDPARRPVALARPPTPRPGAFAATTSGPQPLLGPWSLRDELTRAVPTRAPAPAPGAQPEPAAVTAGLRLALERHGKADLWRLLDGQTLTTAPSSLPPRRLPASSSPRFPPVRAAFGPLGAGDAARAIGHAAALRDRLEELVGSREAPGAGWELWVVYENDGSNLVPDFGRGTAQLYVYARRRGGGPAPSRRGVTAPWPSTGAACMDVGVTVSPEGQTSVEVFGPAGVDGRTWGKVVQDAIHAKLSRSPLFPWPTGTKPLAELGVAGAQTLDRLTSKDLGGLTYVGRLEFEQSAVVGTQRIEGGLRACFVVRTACLSTPIGHLWLEFSPAGTLTRCFMRYHDGRMATLKGFGAAVNASFTVDLGPVGLGLAGELLMGAEPAAHGTGRVILPIAF